MKPRRRRTETRSEEIDAHLEARRKDKGLQARLRRSMREKRRVLERLLGS